MPKRKYLREDLEFPLDTKLLQCVLVPFLDTKSLLALSMCSSRLYWHLKIAIVEKKKRVSASVKLVAESVSDDELKEWYDKFEYLYDEKTLLGQLERSMVDNFDLCDINVYVHFETYYNEQLKQITFEKILAYHKVTNVKQAFKVLQSVLRDEFFEDTKERVLVLNKCDDEDTIVTGVSRVADLMKYSTNCFLQSELELGNGPRGRPQWLTCCYHGKDVFDKPLRFNEDTDVDVMWDTMDKTFLRIVDNLLHHCETNYSQVQYRVYVHNRLPPGYYKRLKRWRTMYNNGTLKWQM